MLLHVKVISGTGTYISAPVLTFTNPHSTVFAVCLQNWLQVQRRDWLYVINMIGNEDPQHRRWVMFRNVFGSSIDDIQFLGTGGQPGVSSLMCVLLYSLSSSSLVVCASNTYSEINFHVFFPIKVPPVSPPLGPAINGERPPVGRHTNRRHQRQRRHGQGQQCRRGQRQSLAFRQQRRGIRPGPQRRPARRSPRWG
jgi:hypothetical protein